MHRSPRQRKSSVARKTPREHSVSVVFALAIGLLGIGGTALLIGAGPDSVIPSASAVAAGQLYFTTFRPPAVEQVTFSYHAGHLQLQDPHVITRLPRADGVLFGSNGRLFVGGVRTGMVYSVNPHTRAFETFPSGVSGAMHLALSPDAGTLYTSGEPGALAALSLNPTQPGHQIVLHGSTTAVTALAFGPGHQVLYTMSPFNGQGDIGLINLATGETRSLFHHIVGAHGILYDPWSRSYLVVGGDVVLQLAAANPTRIESEVILRANSFDQAAVTGRGQILIASNSGSLVLIDYSRSGHVGDVENTVVEAHLARNLDDVAPLIGPGARPVETSARLRRLVGAGALAISVLLIVVLLFLLERRGRRERVSRLKHRPLPRWDRRRRPVSGNRHR